MKRTASSLLDSCARMLRPNNSRLLLFALSLFLYGLLVFLGKSLGHAASAALFPVITAAACWGWRAGLAAGLCAFPVNLLALIAIGYDWRPGMLSPIGLMGHSLFVIQGLLIGFLRDLYLQRQDAEKRLQEEAQERMTALHELSITKEYLEDVITNSLDAIVIADADGRITRVNRALLDLAGRTMGELIGQKTECLSEIEQGTYQTSDGETFVIGPDFFEASRAARERLQSEGRIRNWESYLMGKGRVLVPVEASIILLNDRAGRRTGMVGILRDITHRRRTEGELKQHRDHLNDLVLEKTVELSIVNEKLAESNQRLQERELLLNEAQYIARIGNWEWNFETGANSWSDQFFRILGYEPGEVVPRLDLFIEHIHHDDLDMVLESHRAFDFDNPYLEREFRIITKDGEVRHVASHVWSDRQEDGNATRIFGTMQDISARKAVEEELRRREIVLQDAQAIAHVANWERDLMADSNYWSDEYYRILGYEPGEIESTFENFFNHIHPEDQEKFVSQHMTGDIIDLDFRIIRKSGEQRFVTALAKVDMGAGDMPERVHGVLMDITARKTAEEEIRRYQTELEELVRERTAELEAAQRELVAREKLSVLGRLTATVSHELRNPLGVIRSSIFYLQKKLKNPDEKTGKHLQRVEEQISICDAIVDELLEYTRGRQSEMAPGDIGALMRELPPLIQAPAGVTIEWPPEGVFPLVGLDRDKIKRVFINLVQNAMQAVAARQEKEPAFRPRVSLSASADDGGVNIQVRDNGIGMDEETARRAFEPLFTTRARGTGLGLSIVQKIVHEHSGTVELESKPGKGTTVTVRLPVQPM